jgi:signal transduction histidine kinase
MADTLARSRSDAQPLSFSQPAVEPGRQPFTRLVARLRAGSPAEQYGFALTLVFLIGVMDYVTGIEISVAFCYLLPIYLLAVTRGRTGAIVGAMASVGARVPLIGIATMGRHHFATMTWNLLVDFVLFTAIGQAFAAWRAAEQRSADREVQMREALMATVSHDLKSPLSVVLLESTRLLESTPRDDPPRVRHLEAIRRSALRMSALIRDLLDVARFQNGRLFLDKRDHELNALLEDALDDSRPAADARDVALSLEIDEGAPRVVHCDGARIAQVLGNLIGNAIRFTPPRGNVVVRATLDARELVISVVDEGPGVHRADVEHVFERFWQGPRRSGGSAGLGLPIARSIVEAHGGRIWVDPLPDRGSAFRFTLPG